MKKNRYMLCLLFAGFMLYLAVPRLSVKAEGAAGIFAIAWLTFALMVMAGNLTGILYSPKKTVHRQFSSVKRKKSRSYH